MDKLDSFIVLNFNLINIQVLIIRDLWAYKIIQILEYQHLIFIQQNCGWTRKTVFYKTKGHLLGSKRRHIGRQEAAYWKSTDHQALTCSAQIIVAKQLSGRVSTTAAAAAWAMADMAKTGNGMTGKPCRTDLHANMTAAPSSHEDAANHAVTKFSHPREWKNCPFASLNRNFALSLQAQNRN